MIYLDNHATTQCDPEVLNAMLPYFSKQYGNAASGHNFGREVAQAIQRATCEVGQFIGAESKEIIFTSGATESNNLAILGATKSLPPNGKRRQLITTPLENKSIIAPFQYLQTVGWEIIYLPVDASGRIDEIRAAELITEETFLLSAQLANSEIGTIQPISAIGKIAKDCGVIVHCDAAQALGKTPINVDDLNVDLLSISAHKIYGPKGIGALWVNPYTDMHLKPLIYGGNPVLNLRPGTLPTPLIVGLGEASRLCQLHLVAESRRLATLRNQFEQLLLKRIVGLKVNGSIHHRLPNNSNLTFPRISADALLANVPELMASTSSACEFGSIEPSRTLLGIGLSREEAANTLRFGFGRFTTDEEVESAVGMLIEACSKLTQLIYAA